MTETDVTLTTPQGWDDKPLPKRNGSRGMLPGTWLNREVQLGLLDAGGREHAVSGVLLDWFGYGVCMNSGGARVLYSWDRIASVELTD